MTEKIKKKIWLSHSGLEGLERCPRCFWLQYNRKIYQPEGIVSRLANRFDGVIKKYFDAYRESGKLPPVIEGRVDGFLENPFQEKYFYNVDERYGFLGKLDDCLVTKKGRYTPIDHKTSSSDPRIEREMIPAYQAQLDSYAFLLETNGKPASGIGHLIYYYPEDASHLHRGVTFAVVVKTLDTHPEAVLPRIKRGIKILEGSMPAPSPECPFCSWRAILDNEL